MKRFLVYFLVIVIGLFFILRVSYGFSIFGVSTECVQGISYKSEAKFKAYPADARKIAFSSHPIQFLIFGVRCVYN